MGTDASSPRSPRHRRGTYLDYPRSASFSGKQGVIGWEIWWQYFIVGIGVALLIDAEMNYRSNDKDSRWVGRLIAGIALVGVGIAFLVGESFLWPLVIIAVGVAILLSSLLRKR